MVGDSARDDESKTREVRIDVQREAVARNPSRDPHADCGELVLPSGRSDPDPCETSDPSRGDAEFPDSANQHLFEIAHVPVDVAPVGLQIDDRIADELTGTVKGHVAAASRFEQLDAFSLECFGRGEHVRSLVSGPNAERDDVGMLQQEELIGDDALLALVDELALNIQRVLVGDAAEAPYIQFKPGGFARSRASYIQDSSNCSSRSLM